MGIEVLGCIQYFSHLKRVFLMRRDKRCTQWKRRGFFFLWPSGVLWYSAAWKDRLERPRRSLILFQLLLRILKSRLKPNQSAPATQSGSRDTDWCHRFDRFLCSVDAQSLVTSDRVKKTATDFDGFEKKYVHWIKFRFEKLTCIRMEKQTVKWDGKVFFLFFKSSVKCKIQLGMWATINSYADCIIPGNLAFKWRLSSSMCTLLSSVSLKHIIFEICTLIFLSVKPVTLEAQTAAHLP